ncbi:MAG: CRTAC1 family protein [Planctomycetes bacterium]|nr:CRTAC1 family protein [Planctomycetota bacterium]
MTRRGPSAARVAARGLPAIAVLAGTGCWRDGGSPAPAVPPPRDAAPSEAAARPASFGCEFADITEVSGIRFAHVTGARGEKLLPETMGSGAALLDFDRDGRLDLFLVSSTYWPDQAPAGAPGPRSALYRGRGGGAFEDVTEAAGAGVEIYGMGCAAADPDGDGDQDILVTGVGATVLLEQEGGRFRDRTREAGIGVGSWKDRDGRERPGWTTAAAWADLDLDGDLDLFVASYVQWTPEGEIFTTLDGVTKAFTTPDRYRGLPPLVYRNGGDGRFDDATAASGLGGLEGKSLGVALWDFDADGLLDLVVANDTRPNFFCRNLGGLRFAEAGIEAGIAYDETGRARAGMGIDIQDTANDGTPRVAIGNFANEPMSLYRWTGAASFASEAARAGLAGPTYAPLTFGLGFQDLDLDGALDLVVVNGHIEPDIARVFREQSYPQRAQVFRGRGDGAFDDVTAVAGPAFAVPRVGRALAAGDIDSDGDVDLVITTNGGPPAILRNDRKAAASSRYLRVRLRGKGMNTAALGATIRLTAGGVTQTRVVRTGSSYLSQSELDATFGLGPQATVERLVVRWPSGAEKVVPVGALDRTIEVAEE